MLSLKQCMYIHTFKFRFPIRESCQDSHIVSSLKLYYQEDIECINIYV